jgi:hypothetical protein
MDDLGLRLSALLRVLPPFVCFMAAVYLALHIVLARLLPANRPSATLWFFSVVTGPLTRPIRACLPSGTPEARVRLVSLGVYVGLWIVSRLLINQLAPTSG